MSDVQTEPGSRAEGELLDYRPVCIPAFAGLILGLLAPLALLHPVLWALPPLGALVCLYALYMLATSAPMTGRRAALVGLALALVFCVWPPVSSFSYDWLARRDAARFAKAWFAFLANSEPHKAYQLTVSPGERSPLDETLWNSYRTRTMQREGLESYLQMPMVRVLMALGERARVRLFATETSGRSGNYDQVDNVYAVTYEEEGQTKTFFVRLQMVRNTSTAEGPVQWRISSAEGGVKPLTMADSR
jgi:hypothetical protein